MIEDTVDDMLNAVITWLYELLAYLARAILYMLPPDFTSLSGDAFQFGILLGSNFKLVVFASYAIVIVVGGFLVMSHETLQTRYSLREIAPRLVIGILLTGLVWTIVAKAVFVNNDVVSAFVSADISTEGAICTNPAFDVRTDPLDECDWQEGAEHSQFAYWVLFTPRFDQEIGLFHIIMIIISIACLLVLLVTSVLRYIVLFFLATLAPVALACHGLPVTESFAHLWWRMLGACMASSIGQAALIWVWHEMRQYLPGEGQDELLGYSFITRHVYLMVLVWMMWKVHAEAFRIARGRPVKVPGSRLLAAFVMSKIADRGSGSKRKFTTPGTVWGTDMRRPPWRREHPDSESAKQQPRSPGNGRGKGNGGSAPPRQPRGGPDSGPTRGGGSGSGRPVPVEPPTGPHDQRVGAEPAHTPAQDTADAAPKLEVSSEGPSWKQPLPEVAEGGFDPQVATGSLRGRPNGNSATPAKPSAAGMQPERGREEPSWKRPLPEVAEGGFDLQVATGSLRGQPSGASAALIRPPEANRSTPNSTPAPAEGRPDPRAFASFEDYQASCPQGGAACRGCGGTCEFAKYWHRFHPEKGSE